MTLIDRPHRDKMLVCLDLLEPAGRDEDPAAFQRCIDGSRRLLSYAREAEWSIVHCLGREWPARAASGLEPLASEAVYLRDGLSAFSSRGFRRRLQLWSLPELVIIGCSLSTTCLATALAAHDRGVPARLVLDAISVRRDEAVGSTALARVVGRIAGPFVQMSYTDDLIDRRRALRLVTAS